MSLHTRVSGVLRPANITAMQAVNVFTATFDYDSSDPEGYRSGVARVGEAAGGQELTVKLFEIPAGQSLCPYHYEYVEEWLVVLDGTVILRTPDREEPLSRGDVVCFPAGPEGAHKLTNRGDRPVQALMFSSAREPAVAVYPDSDKIGVWTPGGTDNVMLNRADGHVGYYEGEA
jgi:uncharacterized cupin superfamily protein